jgi:pimeloyl-ACP methyl ester carboxylesterase
MPKVRANEITINYDQQGTGEPLILIPYLAADYACYAFQVEAPTQITFGRYDMVTSTRFADPLKQNIQHAELVIFEGCAHAPIYEKVDEFNQTTLEFLKRHTG